jgi:alkanesulfonate monooxygenase SsuD/methylene tetrahydromethanopterin reductase-like flavin-dependent oxidoreductase (luciferase family)
MRTSVVLGQWLDRPLEADLEVAVLADRLGYTELWVPEMAKADSPAMATLIAERTDQIEFTLGPLPVTVRSSVQIAIALQTVAVTGRPVHVALGTSSSLVAR